MRGLLAFALCISLGVISAVSALAVGTTKAAPGPSTTPIPPASVRVKSHPVVTDPAPGVAPPAVVPHRHAPHPPVLVAEERVEAELPPLATLPAPRREDVALAPSFPALAAALFANMNAARTHDGLPMLVPDKHLDAVAMARAQDLAEKGYFDHYAPDGSSAFSELAERRIPYRIAGENLARNNYPRDRTEGVAFTALMESPGHRANILEPRFARIGAAAVFDGEFWIYVTVFSD